MVRSAPHGELSAPTGVRFTLATSSDEAAIRRLLRATPMHGRISVSFEREPDYFLGAGLAGGEDQIILAFDRERLVCLGRCITRPCWLNGTVRRVGYLGELRLDASAQGRVEILRHGYDFFHQLHRANPAAFTFTSIASDNQRARRLLERGLRGFPRYDFLTEFTTVIIPASPQRRATPRERDHASPVGLAEFLNAENSQTHLAAAWSAEQLHALSAYGLDNDQIHVLRVDGRIVAAGAVWDQRTFRQTVIRGYAGSLAALRPALNLLSRLIGGPRLPSPGSVLAHAFVSPFAITSGHESLLPGFLALLADKAARRGLTHLTLGFPAGDPRLATVQSHFRVRVYSSRLYRVIWPDDETVVALDGRRISPDVALL